MQRHFGADMFQRLHLEVGIAHPGFDGSERMLDRFAALTHLFRVLIEPPLDSLKNMFVLPAGNPALLVRGALILDGAGVTGGGPIAMQRQVLFPVCEAPDEAFTGRATIDVVLGYVDKVLFAKSTLGLDARGLRFGQGDRNAVLIAGQDLFAFEVSAIGNNFQLVCLESRLGPLGHV